MTKTTEDLTRDIEASLNRAFKALLGGAAPLVTSYSRQKKMLWDFKSLVADAEFAKKTSNGLVLLWDKSDSSAEYVGGVKIAEHVNPLTWSVCALEKFPKLKVVVLDLDEASHSSYSFYKVIKALNPASLPLQLLTVPFLVKDCKTFLEGGRQPESKTAVDMLIRQIGSALTERGEENNHHALASIIGPLILIPSDAVATLPDGEEKAHLRSLFEAVKLLDDDKKNPPTRLDIGDLKLVLFDDRAADGWDKWLARCISGRVVYKSKASDFTGFVNKCYRTKNEKNAGVLDRRFSLSLPDCVIGDKFALLLDIHLFDKGSDSEKEFFVTLVKAINSWQFTRRGLAWDPIPIKDLRAVAKWAIYKLSDSDRPRDEVLLTLFPRFLALLDPSLPIVIFSTTLQRPILQKLKGYGNIYTGLNKNPFAGGEAPIEYLRDNLPSIKNFNNLRQKFRALEKVTAIATEAEKFKHWEIYIDEASVVEGNFFRVAGLMVGYEGEKQAEAIHKDMTNAGIRWWSETEIPAPQVGEPGWLRKERNELGPVLPLNIQWRLIAKKLESIVSGLPKYSFCLWKESVNGFNPADDAFRNPRLCAPNSLDNCYFSLLADMLEAALFDVLGSINGNKSPTVGIFAASRRRSFKDQPHDQTLVNDNRDKYAAFGVSLHLPRRPIDSKPAYQAMPMDGVLPVVSELVERRYSHELAQKLAAGILSAAAVPINQPEKRDPSGDANFDGSDRLTSPPFRNLHFIADIMASLANTSGIDYGVLTKSPFGFGPNNVNKALFERRRGVDEGFLCLQRISRLLDPNDENVIAAAWLFFQMEESVEVLLKGGMFAKSVLSRLRKALETDLTGFQLHQLATSHHDALALVVKSESIIKRIEKLDVDLRRAAGDMRASDDELRKLREEIVGAKNELRELKHNISASAHQASLARQAGATQPARPPAPAQPVPRFLVPQAKPPAQTQSETEKIEKFKSEWKMKAYSRGEYERLKWPHYEDGFGYYFTEWDGGKTVIVWANVSVLAHRKITIPDYFYTPDKIYMDAKGNPISTSYFKKH